MRKIVINGGKPSKGEVVISGTKNGVVALVSAIIPADGIVVLDGVSAISGVDSLIEIMEIIGAKVKREEDTLEVDPRGIKNQLIPYGRTNSLHASYYSYGSLLSRFGEATVSLPDGCDLGPRPIDLHLKAFEAMGATILYGGEAMCLATNGEFIRDAHIYMNTVSVEATTNTMLTATKANGRMIIGNAVCEPEIIDAATLLNNMGTHIRNAGTDVIITEDVDYLHGTRHQVIPDRIEVGIYIAMAVAMGEGVRIINVLYEHLESYIAKLGEMGVRIAVGEDSIFVEKQSVLKVVSVKTSPYPGFTIDLQQPVTPLLLTAEGCGTILDTICEERTNHVAELVRIGADISIVGGRIAYQGSNKLTGVPVKASNLRVGAALVIASLVVEGQTETTNVELTLRGYSSIIEKLTVLGADIKLIED